MLFYYDVDYTFIINSRDLILLSNDIQLDYSINAREVDVNLNLTDGQILILEIMILIIPFQGTEIGNIISHNLFIVDTTRDDIVIKNVLTDQTDQIQYINIITKKS